MFKLPIAFVLFASLTSAVPTRHQASLDQVATTEAQQFDAAAPRAFSGTDVFQQRPSRRQDFITSGVNDNVEGTVDGVFQQRPSRRSDLITSGEDDSVDGVFQQRPSRRH
ncbi:hypothetical protein DL96DRAFT_1726614 [Flagelloscypha sp. PMI_526]|nr:hypothetical protein DL96DRAFT_1726614 [Flagelloscypha sp. PMI_526]